MTSIQINSERLSRRIDALAELTLPDRPWERTAFSSLHKQARSFLQDVMQQIGLETRIDAGGNLIGRQPGLQNDAGPISIGSHSDTVPEGGRFDGVAGVVVAMEIAQTLSEANVRLQHPLEVIDFLAEEPNKYGLSCVGSRAMAGHLSQSMLDYTAPDGSDLRSAIQGMGGDPAQLDKPLRRQGDMAAFLELHIEQGRVLEEAEDDIGCVTEIVGITRLDVEIVGMADHSGATPMSLRKDALAAAAQLVLAFEAKACEETRGAMVATVGKLDVSPNASNAVPGRVSFNLEIRAGQQVILDDFLAWAEDTIKAVCTKRSLTANTKVIGTSNPVVMADPVQGAILKAAQSNGLKARSMPSGAGHDAAYMARLAPTGMVFIPCAEGRSHCPEEYTTPEQLAKGAQTLLDAVLRLDADLTSQI